MRNSAVRTANAIVRAPNQIGGIAVTNNGNVLDTAVRIARRMLQARFRMYFHCGSSFTANASRRQLGMSRPTLSAWLQRLSYGAPGKLRATQTTTATTTANSSHSAVHSISVMLVTPFPQTLPSLPCADGADRQSLYRQHGSIGGIVPQHARSRRLRGTSTMSSRAVISRPG